MAPSSPTQPPPLTATIADPPDPLDAPGAIAESSGVPAALGQRVGVGMVFMVLSALASRSVALIAQGVLAFLLTQADFGIFAIATAAAAIAQLFRDGGLRFVLLQKGSTEYEKLSGPVFWQSLAFNIGTAMLMGAAAPLVAHIYHDPRLVLMLALIALTVPVGTFTMMCDIRLRVDLRFKVIAAIAAWSSVIRYAVTIAAAWLGAGPMSLVYGLLFVTVFEFTALFIAAPERCWRRPARLDLWGGLFAQGKWTIVQGLAVSLIYYGMYASIGLFVSPDIVGVYSFAFAILTQSGQLLAAQFENVLLPSIARLQGQPERRRAAVVRSLHAMAVSCVPLSLYVGVIYGPVENLIWKERWAESIPCVWIMALTYPLFVLHVLPRAVLMSAGRFRSVAHMMLVVGAGMSLSAGLAAWLGRSAVWITAGTGAYSVLAAIWMMLRGLAPEGVRARTVVGSVVPVAAVLSVAAASVVVLDQALLMGLHPAVRCVIVGSVGGLAMAGLLRTVFPESLRDLIRVAPGRLAGPIRRALRLAESAPNSPSVAAG